MAKDNNDYDSVFKTLKLRETRLFIPVINEVFGKAYPMDAKVELRSPDGQLITIGENGDADISDRISDMVLCIEDDWYVVECQSYEDDMAIRIAEYTFIVAKGRAEFVDGRLHIRIPESAVIYVKGNSDVSDETEIVYDLPDGKSFTYRQKNVVISRIGKEEIISKKLLPYIPYYVTRYERRLIRGRDVEQVKDDLGYLNDGLQRMYENKEISLMEYLELRYCTNTIVTHITNGNSVEKEVTEIMGGGVILESPVKKLKDEGRVEGRIEAWAEANRQITALNEQITAKDEQSMEMKKEIEELKEIIRRMGGEV